MNDTEPKLSDLLTAALRLADSIDNQAQAIHHLAMSITDLVDREITEQDAEPAEYLDGTSCL